MDEHPPQSPFTKGELSHLTITFSVHRLFCLSVSRFDEQLQKRHDSFPNHPPARLRSLAPFKGGL